MSETLIGTTFGRTYRMGTSETNARTVRADLNISRSQVDVECCRNTTSSVLGETRLVKTERWISGNHSSYTKVWMRTHSSSRIFMLGALAASWSWDEARV